MGRFLRWRLWQLRAGKLKWIFLSLPIAVILAIVQEWIFSDITEYIRSLLGVDLNIVELASRMPITIVAILLAVAIGIWILRTGSKDSALQDLYKTLFDIRDTVKTTVASNMREIIAQHQREFNQEADFLALQELQNLKWEKKGKKDDITPEELTTMRIQRLIPRNTTLEDFINKNRNLDRLWKRVRSLQTVFMDDLLDKRIDWLERMIKLNNAYRVYNEVMTQLYIISDLGILSSSVKITEDALAEAHDKVNKRLSELAHNKELFKVRKVAEGGIS